MDFEKNWERAIGITEIERSWIGYLKNTSTTMLPYLMLCESLLDNSDTVIRKGKIEVTKPIIYLPEHNPVFEGFEFSKDNISENSVLTFFLLRGINLPSLKYSNTVYSLDMERGSLSDTIKKYKQELERLEDLKTALIVGADDCWHLSLLIYVAALTEKSVSNDIKSFLENLKNRYKKD
ncbi:MAG: hypothetical protein P9M06_07740 [Candidatus Saelkia tenebricola]|nr:hypothetical protein [Candidatus Saelkia tenebricola]